MIPIDGIGKEMKSISADDIDAGYAAQNLRTLIRDLASAIAIDDDLSIKRLYRYYHLYSEIICAMAEEHVDPSIVICQYNTQENLGLTEDEINYHIFRVESKYRKFVPIVRAFLKNYVDLVGKEMKSISIDDANADREALINGLISAIAIDKDLIKKSLVIYFSLYFVIIREMATGRVDPSIVIRQANRLMNLGLTEKEIHYHISRVKSDYRKFVLMMREIVNLKLNDYKNLGASENAAYNCLHDWINMEYLF